MPIIQAINNGDLKTLRSLVRANPNALVRRRLQNGSDVLHAAAHAGHIPILEYLFDRDLPWRTNDDGHTPLDIARRFHPQREDLFQTLKIYCIYKANLVRIPTNDVKACCPWENLREVKVIIPPDPDEERLGIEFQQVFASLHHTSRKTDEIKSTFNLSDIHHELRVNLSKFPVPETGNIISASITFPIKIVRTGARHYINFPLKIPGKAVYSHTDGVKAVEDQLPRHYKRRSEAISLNLLEYLYTQGKRICNPRALTHGHQPKYDGSQGDAQYINHSEQSIALYLITPSCAQMLITRLRATIRAQNLASLHDEVKVYGAIFHFHSSKTPCGACEYVLTGLQNEPAFVFGNPETTFGLGYYLKEQLKAQSANPQTRERDPSQMLVFSRPHGGYFPIYTTYTADSSDSTHRKAPTHAPTNWRDCQESAVEIHADPLTRNKIHVANFNAPLPERLMLQADGDVAPWTIFTSASTASPLVRNVNAHRETLDRANIRSLRRPLIDLFNETQ